MRNLLAAGLKKLRSSTPQHESGNRHARLLAVAARKGGVGKTTTTVNLACALARHHGHRVLVVDVDPQGHVAATLRDSVPPGRVTLSDILLATKPRDLLDAVVETSIKGVHVTPPDKTLNETEALLATRVGREFILQGTLQTVRTRYDTVLIDCPPNLGNLTLNALTAAHHVLIPCDMSILAFEGVADLMETVATVNDRLHHTLDVAGIVRTRVDRRNVQVNRAIESALDDNYGDRLLGTVIPVNSALAQAQSQGVDIFQFAPRSRGATAYRALAQELVGRLASDQRHIGPP